MKKSFLLLFFATQLAHAYTPYFTGPLLAPSGKTVAPKHINYEPYFFYTDNQGVYNSHWRAVHMPQTHNFIPSPFATIGLTNFLDFQLTIPFNFNWSRTRYASNISDISAGFGLQALHQQQDSWLPDLRILLLETFPTGKHDRLNPLQFGTDGSGTGAYQSAISLNFQYLLKLKQNYLRTRLSLAAMHPTRVKLNGFSTYGGGFGTNGRISPGNNLSADLAFEYSLTQNWVPVFEVSYVKRQETKFVGNPGRTRLGTIAIVGHGKVDQVTLAPAVEYNFSDKFGIIAGTWLTVAGRDTSEFISGVLAINYYA